MGFQKPDLEISYQAVRKAIGEIRSPYNDGFTQSHCKQELYMLKCWLDNEYRKLPTFVGEEKWEQEQLVEILKQ
jgi:hypothetical protein